MLDLETFAKFLAVVPDPMVVADARGMIVLANDATCRLFGYDGGALTGEPVIKLIPERFRASHSEHFEAYFQSPNVRPVGAGLELSALHSSGSEFPVEISLSPYRTKNASYVLAAIRDIRMRKNLEQARLESVQQKEMAEERARVAQDLADRNEALRVIFEASPLGIITASQDGAIDRWNRAAERIYGYSASEAIGCNIWDLIKPIKPEDDARKAQIFSEVSEGRELRDFQIRQRRRDGKPVEISLNTAPFRGSDGKHSGFVFLVDDVTEQKTIEQQLRQAQKMEAVGQLTGGIAHDFNNLLSIVICNLELLQEQLTPESEDRELSDLALNAALHGAELVKQLLAFSRKQNLSPQSTNVNELVLNMTNLLKRALGEQIEIVLELQADLLPAIADPAQLQTALVNLATNARDAMPKGGKLVMQTGNVELDQSYVEEFVDVNPGDYVMVAVTDTGSGMSPETAERAFDPFFTTKPAGKGTGLGLSMVFGFIKQSGGHVRIYSEEGLGTTVRLYLPRASQEQAGTTRPRKPQEKLQSKGANILIVEDNKDLAKSARRVLSDAGYEVAVAGSAEEALRLLRGPAQFELLFTDIILTQGENGIELAQHAVELKPEIKVLFSSGFSEAALRVSGKVLADHNFLAKPYRKEELISRVYNILKGSNG